MFSSKFLFYMYVFNRFEIFMYPGNQYIEHDWMRGSSNTMPIFDITEIE